MRKTKRTPSPEPLFANSPARAYPGGLLRRWVREGGPEVPVSGYFVVKRAMDCALALALAVVTAPLAGLALVLVRLTSRGPGIYTQRRVGLGGREFTIYKIRTMIDNCESLTGPRWSVPGDPRVTPVGAVLRKLHVDELPQLWNVLRGDMSLIGPRPERPEFVDKLAREIPDYDLRHTLYPGITGLAQVQLPPDTEVGHVEQKLRFDLHYVRHLGLRLDLTILGCTVLKVLGVPVTFLRKLLGIANESWAAPFRPTGFAVTPMAASRRSKAA
jgi:lipopolysaccharide/colanic/teichoic acid biosynthesis glycosyltransferase